MLKNKQPLGVSVSVLPSGRPVLTSGGVHSEVGVVRVRVALRGEHADVAARVLGAARVHQPQRAVAKRHPVGVQLQVGVPGRRHGAAARLGVVSEYSEGLLAAREAPVEEGLVEGGWCEAGEGHVSALGPSHLCRGNKDTNM